MLPVLQLSILGAILCFLGGVAMGAQFAVLRMRTRPEDRGKDVSRPGLILTGFMLWIGTLFYGSRMIVGFFAPLLVGASTPVTLITGYAYWVIFSAGTGLGYRVVLKYLSERERERNEREAAEAAEAEEREHDL